MDSYALLMITHLVFGEDDAFHNYAINRLAEDMLHPFRKGAKRGFCPLETVAPSMLAV